MKRFIPVIILLIIVVGSLSAQSPSITAKTKDMQKFEGFFDFYWDEKDGKVWLEINKFDFEFLYVISLTAGLGSNDVGLDRNQLGETKLVKFIKIGPKVLLVEPNYRFRAESENPDERKAVTDAFAQSVIWGFKVSNEENGRLLVDATGFFLRDAHNIIGTLKNSNQGTYSFDESRSAFFMENTKNFPKNSEIETIITVIGNNPGGYVQSVASDGRSVTVRQHHSFVELPDGNYTPRAYDPRSSYGFSSYQDYATPISESITKRFINRHRLHKKNPNEKMGEAVEPIVYYVDRGTPEPIRSALIKGASWWNQAFEAAGFRDAFRVELLPEGADPMDLRYNMINWVHRSTRGWSYGSSVTDPRTGEIIKGHVTLGSLRVRQDFLIAASLLAPYKEGERLSSEMEEMALARIRQLSVHEVGHTIGLMHNYTSSVHDRSSVMDYPHPLIKVNSDGSFDLSDAYDTGVGEWDKIAVQYGYTDFSDNADENAELDKIIQNGFDRGFYMLTDQDARDPGSAHPLTHLWDNGKHPVDELERVLEIRHNALENFSENNIRPGEPLATLEDVLVPLYLLHRYQVEASVKVLGGVYYFYNLRGDGQELPEIVSPDEQRRAFNVLLSTIEPAVLALDERIVQLIPPRPPGYGQSPELFAKRTGAIFDPVSAAETAADLTIQFILNPARAARLVYFHALDQDNPGLVEILEKLVAVTWGKQRGNDYHSEIQRAVDKVFLNRILSLAANKQTASQVRAVCMQKIDDLKTLLETQSRSALSEANSAHIFYGLKQIEMFEKDPEKLIITEPLRIPAGAPIGSYLEGLINGRSIFRE